MAIRAEVKVNDQTMRALNKIEGICDRVIGECARDGAQLSKALMRDGMKAPTGKLEQSVKAERYGRLNHAIVTTAENEQGVGYGAKQEWGFHDRSGNKVKGRHYILRGFWGMVKRYQRGEKWRA